LLALLEAHHILHVSMIMVKAGAGKYFLHLTCMQHILDMSQFCDKMAK
jgi:hypothetical protein